MDLPEGPTSREYRQELRRHVRTLSEDDKTAILGRSEEFEGEMLEEYFARRDILLELGFTSSEAQFLARCRLNSPGIRTMITERVAITQYAKPKEIAMLNEGDGSILLALKRLYILGGIE